MKELLVQELDDSAIDEAIITFKMSVDETLKSFPDGAFVRLSTRRYFLGPVIESNVHSPKDAVQWSDAFKMTFKEELVLSPSGEVDPNLDDIAWYRCVSPNTNIITNRGLEP